jgi:hypothetical protein
LLEVQEPNICRSTGTSAQPFRVVNKPTSGSSLIKKRPKSWITAYPEVNFFQTASKGNSKCNSDTPSSWNPSANLPSELLTKSNTPAQYIGDNAGSLKKAFRDVEHLFGSYQGLLAIANQNDCTRQAADDVMTLARSVDEEYLITEIPKAIDQTIEGIDRVSTLVLAMKEFSHPGIREKALADLNRGIVNTITVAGNEWKSGALTRRRYLRLSDACMLRIVATFLVVAVRGISQPSQRRYATAFRHASDDAEFTGRPVFPLCISGRHSGLTKPAAGVSV